MSLSERHKEKLGAAWTRRKEQEKLNEGPRAITGDGTEVTGDELLK